ncbi:MAG: TIR domain-containing protein [Opitutus sp.]|nr:TIR domain-containing protein [Opitutus sp.]
MPTPAIFLSYARDDAAAARRIAEALRSSGVEVWFDENELRGGDTWDAKIRKQIDECTLFVPLISQHTEARAKGYFRLEWKLAVDQSQMMAAGVPFIAPVAIDDTREGGAVVPPEFLRVQWMRLPGALPTPEFVAQMKRLLDAPKVAPVASDVARCSRPVGSTDTGRETRATKTRGPTTAWIGAVVVIGIAATYFSNRKPEPAARRSAPPTVEKSAASAPVSAARQLVAKARALYEPWDLARPEDFALAEKLLKQAVDLDPADAEAWAAYAILSCGMSGLRHDSSAERIAAARTQAENAIKFSPDSDQARFARAFSLRFNSSTRDEAIRLLRGEAGRQPTNRLVLRVTGSALRMSGQHAQALVYYDKAVALPGSDPVSQHNRAQSLFALGRFDEAEVAWDESLALAPQIMDAQREKLNFLLDVRGDLARAQAHLAKVPPAFFLDDRGAVIAYYVALYARDPGKCLEYLRHAKDSLADGYGPKAALTADAHRLAGNAEAARTDFKAALRVVDDRLASEPNNGRLLLNRAVILIALGDRAAAEPLVREIRQRANTVDSADSRGVMSVAQLLAQLGEHEGALAALESVRQVEFSKGSLSTFRVFLRYHPVWDPLRGNPRFEALLKAAEQKK